MEQACRSGVQCLYLGILVILYREPTGAMDVSTYLDRIRYSGPTAPSKDTMRGLHRAHVLHVPFENLDVRLGNRVTLDPDAVFDKIVARGRGGFCYELNSLFAWLLEELGFEVTLLSGRVFQGAEPGPEFDHLALLVHLDRRWLIDVGFGVSFIEPLPIDERTTRSLGAEQYRLQSGADDGIIVQRRGRGSSWESQYLFSLTPRRLTDFAAMCDYHQRSTESHFTRRVVCMRRTEDGRVTLIDRELTETGAEARRSQKITGEDRLDAVLRDKFGIALTQDELHKLARLLDS